eukprot:scaffold87106_cov73-Attheya_sp.AAC.1
MDHKISSSVIIITDHWRRGVVDKSALVGASLDHSTLRPLLLIKGSSRIAEGFKAFAGQLAKFVFDLIMTGYDETAYLAG